MSKPDSGQEPPTAAPALGLGWRLLAWPIACAGWLLVRALAATWRFELVAGEGAGAELERDEAPVLLCAWHAGLLPLAAWMLGGPLRGRRSVAFLVSRSRDGELVARLLRLWGARVVRGSSSRGGREALQSLYRVLRRERVSVFALPDGPRGPERRFKPGTLVLAQVAGAAVVPLACRASRSWRLASWDRLAIPKPFARIGLAIGEPLRIPRELSSGEQETWLRRLEGALNGLEGRLKASTGARLSSPENGPAPPLS